MIASCTNAYSFRSGLRTLLLVGVAMLIGACATRTLPTPLPIEIREDAPVQIRVVDEFNDGQMLFVKAAVKALTTWGVDDVRVVLRGLQEGKQVRQTTQPLLALLEGQELPEVGGVKILPVDKEFLLLVSLPSDSISDFQLEVLWGEDEWKAKAGVQSIPVTFQIVSRVEAMLGENTNGREPAGMLEGVLTNNGENTLTSVVLLVGDLSDEVIPIAGLSLPKGESSQVRVKVPPDWDLSGVAISVIDASFASPPTNP